MQPRPTKVTFPGTVRIELAKGQRPPLQRRILDEKGNLRGIEVTVPEGFRLDYDLTHPHPSKNRKAKPTKPQATVRMVKADAPRVTHAELSHEFDEIEHQVQHGVTVHEDGTKEPNMVAVTARTLKSVTADSLEHQGISGKGRTPEEAIANMNAAIDTKLAKRKAADEAEKAADDAAHPGTKSDAKPGLVSRTAPGGHLSEHPEVNDDGDDDKPDPDTVVRHG